MAAAGVLIVREGRVLLSPRPHPAGTHLGWIGGWVEPSESPQEAARREAREEIGCDVEISHAPLTYEEDGMVRLPPPAPLLRTGEGVLYRARPLGEPRRLDVPALVWVPLELLPELREPTSFEALLARGATAIGPVVAVAATAAVVADRVPTRGSAAAAECVSYTLDARKPWQRERVVAPGAPAARSRNAYWAGATLAGRRAVISVERPAVRLQGGPIYATYYELPSTGCRSGYLATADREAPSGEIFVVSDRRSSWASRTTLRIVNGQNAVRGARPVWPRFQAMLAGGERATVIPARGEIAGLDGFRGFIVVLPETMVTVGGTAFRDREIELDDDAVRRLAGSLTRLHES